MVKLIIEIQMNLSIRAHQSLCGAYHASYVIHHCACLQVEFSSEDYFLHTPKKEFTLNSSQNIFEKISYSQNNHQEIG